jgi:hypothetical protein
MRTLLILALSAGGLRAAVILGDVVENQSGRPLARTLVVAQAVKGTGAKDAAMFTTVYGTFKFPALPGGVYLLSASRRGFVTTQYGQKTFRGAGTPVLVEENAEVALRLRLPRFGAISGTVLDENEVGIPDFEVAVFRNTRPPQYVAQAKSDERGVYRVGSLAPGHYLVRSLPRQVGDEGYVPTYSRQANLIDQARMVDAELDRETGYADVVPQRGRLLQVAGRVVVTPLVPVTLTLVTEAGRETVVTTGPFRFSPQAPGPCELYAEAEVPPPPFRFPRSPDHYGAYLALTLDRDRADMSLSLALVRDVSFTFRSVAGSEIKPVPVQVMARRRDLGGHGEPMSLQMTTAGNLVNLAAGRWELMLSPLPELFVAGFNGSAAGVQQRRRVDGWNEIIVAPGTGSGGSAVFLLGASPGSLRGVVLAGQDRAPAAPVYLKGYDPDTRARTVDLRTVRADVYGNYEFTGLAPGYYRVLSTFDYQSPESEEMDLAEAKVVKIEKSDPRSLDLQLYVAR